MSEFRKWSVSVPVPGHPFISERVEVVEAAPALKRIHELEEQNRFLMDSYDRRVDKLEAETVRLRKALLKIHTGPTVPLTESMLKPSARVKLVAQFSQETAREALSAKDE